MNEAASFGQRSQEVDEEVIIVLGREDWQNVSQEKRSIFMAGPNIIKGSVTGKVQSMH